MNELQKSRKDNETLKQRMHYFDCDTFDKQLNTLTSTKDDKDKFTLLVSIKKFEKEIKIQQQQIQVT